MRVSIVVTSRDYLGNEKGEFAFESVTAGIDKAAELVTWPDTIAVLWDVDMSGNRTTPIAQISKESGWYDLRTFAKE